MRDVGERRGGGKGHWTAFLATTPFPSVNANIMTQVDERIGEWRDTFDKDHFHPKRCRRKPQLTYPWP